MLLRECRLACLHGTGRRLCGRSALQSTSCVHSFLLPAELGIPASSLVLCQKRWFASVLAAARAAPLFSCRGCNPASAVVWDMCNTSRQTARRTRTVSTHRLESQRPCHPVPVTSVLNQVPLGSRSQMLSPANKTPHFKYPTRLTTGQALLRSSTPSQPSFRLKPLSVHFSYTISRHR